MEEEQQELSRELTIVLSVSGFVFPDVDRLIRWIERTALDPEAVKTYLPDGAAVMLRGVTSNLSQDAEWIPGIE